MRFKRLMAILLCLCMALTLLPTAALAAGQTTTEVIVGSVRLYGSVESPVYALTEDGAVTTENADADHYNIMWDGETLTLSGANITQGSHENAAIYYGGEDNIDLVLAGDNTVTGPSGDDTSSGIRTLGSLTISGEGRLTATGGQTSSSSYGIYAEGDITVSSGSVTAKGGNAPYYSYGIYSNSDSSGEVKVSGGKVTATGGEVSGDEFAESCGIGAYNINISSGTVTATGGTSIAYSEGMYATNEVTISGGEVTATGDTVAIYSNESSVTVDPAEGEQITVTAGENETGAQELSGSPFIKEEEIFSSISSAKYFHSIAEEAEDPGSGGTDPDPDTPDPNIYVGGVGLYGDKASNTTAYALTNASGAVTTTDASAENYTIMWDGETLTLKNAKITQGAHENAAIYAWSGNFSIHLIGNNTVTGPDREDFAGSYGIYAYGDDIYITVTVSGEDESSLTASGGNLNSDPSYVGSYGFCGDHLNIESGTVSFTGGEVTSSEEDAVSYGISAGYIEITSGTVNANGGSASCEDGYAYSQGIEAGDVTITGGNVTANGGAATAEGDGSYAYSSGIFTYEDLVISDGTLNAKGGKASATSEDATSESFGLDAMEGVTISGGTVTATGDDCGLYASNITIGPDPQEDEAIQVKAGENAANAVQISGSPFTVQTVIDEDTVDTISTAKYFHSEVVGSPDPNPPTITSVTVTPATATVRPGGAQQFTASVTGTGEFSQAVTWSVSGNQSTGTAISDTGLLTVGADETSATLTVTATANGDTTKSGAAVVTVETVPTPQEFTIRFDGNGGTSPAPQTTVDGKLTSLPTSTRSGYDFLGWYTAASGGTRVTLSTVFTENTTLYAHWDRRSSGGGSSRPSEPDGPSTGDSDGWDDIRDELTDARDGDTITIDMNGETEVPAEIFEEAAGRDVTVELDMGGGVLWTFNGLDIPEDTRLHDLDLGVDMDTSGISVDVINAVTGEYGAVQVSLAHDGEFGFALTLSAPLGRENAGYWANLYWFNEETEELEFQQAVRISDNGTAEFDLDHASDYAIVIDDRSHEPAELPFLDVPEGAWYCDAVEYVYRHGLMAGTSDAAFSPDMTTSRAMIVTILWRMAGSPQVNYAMDFSDVPGGAWYSEAVRWAVSEGIAGGYGGGLFGPDDPITREQLAVMLYRCAQHAGYDVSIGEDTNILSYADFADLSEYAIPAMQWACGAGMISGTGTDTLAPQGQATRAQAAVILQRFCEQYVDSQS